MVDNDKCPCMVGHVLRSKTVNSVIISLCLNKKPPTLVSTTNLMFLDDFRNFCTIINRNEHSIEQSYTSLKCIFSLLGETKNNSTCYQTRAVVRNFHRKSFNDCFKIIFPLVRKFF